jgi:hypothetical protein
MNIELANEGFGAHRPIVMGDRGMVVAGHPKAAEAGVAMFRNGGNAMDAAVAAAATLAIAIPFMNGLGGDSASWQPRRRSYRYKRFRRYRSSSLSGEIAGGRALVDARRGRSR